MKHLTFRARQIPHSGHLALGALMGDSPVKVAFRGFHELLLATAIAPEHLRGPESSLALRMSFDPGQADPRDRLGLSIGISGPQDFRQLLRDVITAGPLATLYELEAKEGNPGGTSEDSLAKAPERYVCEVSRRISGVADRDSRYQWGSELKPNDTNDYLAVDRLLDSLEHPAGLVLEAQPLPREYQEREIHGPLIRYLEQLQNAGYNERPAGLSLARRALDGRFLQQILSAPLLAFSVRAEAGTRSAALALAVTVANASMKEGGLEVSAPENADGRHSSLPLRRLGSEEEGPNRLRWIATPEELQGLFRFPTTSGSTEALTARRSVDRNLPEDGEILIGQNLLRAPESDPDKDPKLRIEGDRVVWAGPGREVRLDRKLLTKHLFVAGRPGSGKTTAVMSLLTQLGLPGRNGEGPVPFMVIEPAKTEYRSLLRLRESPDERLRKLGEELLVLTPGRERVSPLRINPFYHPPEISRESHISELVAALSAAFRAPETLPVESILQQAVRSAYLDADPTGRLPRMRALYAKSREVIASSTYSKEVKGTLEAVVAVRLQRLTEGEVGAIFECEESWPSNATLFSSNVVVELDALSEHAASFLTLALLLNLREHVRSVRRSGARGALAHVLVLEEAHNLVPATGGTLGGTNSGEGAATGGAAAARIVVRMLAEMRALGEGIVIADQLPTAVASEVVKNTGSKLVHSLVADDDRRIMASAMVLDQAKAVDLAKLLPGQGYFYSEGLVAPLLVKGPRTEDYASADPGRPLGEGVLRGIVSSRAKDSGQLIAEEVAIQARRREFDVSLRRVSQIWHRLLDTALARRRYGVYRDAVTYVGTAAASLIDEGTALLHSILHHLAHNKDANIQDFYCVLEGLAKLSTMQVVMAEWSSAARTMGISPMLNQPLVVIKGRPVRWMKSVLVESIHQELRTIREVVEAESQSITKVGILKRVYDLQVANAFLFWLARVAAWEQDHEGVRAEDGLPERQRERDLNAKFEVWVKEVERLGRQVQVAIAREEEQFPWCEFDVLVMKSK